MELLCERFTAALLQMLGASLLEVMCDVFHTLFHTCFIRVEYLVVASMSNRISVRRKSNSC